MMHWKFGRPGKTVMMRIDPSIKILLSGGMLLLLPLLSAAQSMPEHEAVGLDALNSADDELLLGWDDSSLYFRRVTRSVETPKDSHWFLSEGQEFEAVRRAGYTDFAEPEPMELKAWSAANWPGMDEIQHVAIDAVRGVLVASAQSERGDFDLFMAQRIGSNWTVPLPLNALNTLGDEVFPNFDQGELLFASNGHQGLGGFDVFRASRASHFERVERMPKGVNTAGDELAAVPAGSKPESGYYISAVRFEGKGLDVWWCGQQEASGGEHVRSIAMEFRYQRMPLKGMKVRINERGGKTVVEGVSDAQGRMLLGAVRLDAAMEVAVTAATEREVPDGAVCHVYEQCEQGGCLDSYWPGWKRVRSYRLEGGKAFVFDLLPLDALGRWPRPSEFDGSDWLGESSAWVAYFDLSVDQVTSQSREELMKWLEARHALPSLAGHLVVSGYADAQGEVVRNHVLSEARAASIVEVLLNAGFSASQIQWNGYGVDSHAQNAASARRVEVEWVPTMH